MRITTTGNLSLFASGTPSLSCLMMHVKVFTHEMSVSIHVGGGVCASQTVSRECVILNQYPGAELQTLPLQVTMVICTSVEP